MDDAHSADLSAHMERTFAAHRALLSNAPPAGAVGASLPWTELSSAERADRVQLLISVMDSAAMLTLLDHHLVAPAFAVLARQPVAELGALVLRISLGALFIAHLFWKFAVCDGGFQTWWTNFTKNGYPRIVPYYVVSAEILGALCLIPGVHTRWVCLYALPLMIGAAHFWQIRKGFFFTTGGSELPIVWALMLLVQSLLGDGAFAVGPII